MSNIKQIQLDQTYDITASDIAVSSNENKAYLLGTTTTPPTSGTADVKVVESKKAHIQTYSDGDEKIVATAFEIPDTSGYTSATPTALRERYLHLNIAGDYTTTYHGDQISLYNQDGGRTLYFPKETGTLLVDDEYKNKTLSYGTLVSGDPESDYKGVLDRDLLFLSNPETSASYTPTGIEFTDSDGTHTLDFNDLLAKEGTIT